MSVIVAIQRGSQVVMASDTLTCFGDELRIPAENSATAKVRRIGDSLVGAAGWAVYDQIFDDYLDDRDPPDLHGERAIFGFFLDLWKALHDGYPFVNDQSQSKDSPFGDLDSTFLIANESGLFRVSNDMDVCRFRQYYAIGSGAEYALGVLHILYPTTQPPTAIARQAVHTACQFDLYCGGDVAVFELPAPA